MASPTDSARQATIISTAGTSHAINVGSPSAGNLLIVFVRFAAAPGAVGFTGYELLASDSSDATDDTTNVYWRQADGGEGVSDTLTTGNSVKLGAIGWVITGHALPSAQIPVISAAAIGTTVANTCDPPALAPGPAGSLDYLFLALGGEDGESGAFTAVPASYANLIASNSGTGGLPATNVLMGGGSRAVTGTTENPGAFTHAAATTGWTAFTVAIFPSSYVRPFRFNQVEGWATIQKASTW